MPPPRASTLHSSAMGGEPPQPSPCAANVRGGSHVVTTERDSMPGPKFNVTATGFPSRCSNSVGTNQDEIPGPVAMACHTSSGVPGTSTSTWTQRRPEASFLTLMMAPYESDVCGPPSRRRHFRRGLAGACGVSRQRVRHDHQAVRAAAWGGFIVVLRNQFRDDLGEFAAESGPFGRRPKANLGI